MICRNQRYPTERAKQLASSQGLHFQHHHDVDEATTTHMQPAEVAVQDAGVATVMRAIKECFAQSAHAGLRSVSCEMCDGVLVLRGRVSSYYYKQLAQEIVRDLAGAIVIVNAVEVVYRIATSSHSRAAKPHNP